jgi:predicted ATPase
MRDARIRDHWRRTFDRTYPTRIESFSFESLPSFHDGALSFSPGITALVGGNGVGKSTLIAAIVEILSNGGVSPEIDRSDRLSESRTRAKVYVNKIEHILSMNTDPSGVRFADGEQFEGDVRWIDPSAFAQSCVKQIRSDRSFSDLLEPITPAILDQEELGSISYLVGKSYTACSIFEINDYGGREIFPYFQVTVSGETYGSENMGRGELSLLLSYWVLRDISKCSILILEEPETHVSPRSQDHLMNVVAKFCDERAICVVAATHSPSIIRRLPPSHIRLITREAHRASVVESPSTTQIARVLSGGVAYKGLFLVEDGGAKSLLLGLLEEFAPDLLAQFEIAIAGDETRITKSMEGVPRTREWLTVFGIYDGGMQDRVSSEKFNWPHVFLPGEQAPEIVLRALIGEGQPFYQELATELKKPEIEIRTALEYVSGVDHHEWIVEFSNMVGRDTFFVRHVLIRLWILKHEELARQFVTSIRAKLEDLSQA